MPVYPSPTKDMEAAMCAKTNLHVFAAVAAILEAGALSGYSGTAAQQIIAICHKEQQRQLKLMDKAVARVNKRAVQLAGHQGEEKKS